jgi:HK97 family phage prohead protease
MEYTSFSLRDVKMSEGEEMTFSGYGAAFNNIDSYGDVIVPGAFADTLADAKISGATPSMLLNHGGWGASAEDHMPIGIWSKMYEDGVGLFVEGKLAKTQRGLEAYELLKMGAITGMSIGYRAKTFEARTKPEDPKRKLTKVDLIEVSLVTFPANGKARVSSVKSDLSIRDAERSLREAGFSREEAKGIVSSGFKTAMSLRDAGDGQTELVGEIQRLINTISPKGDRYVRGK